MLSFLFALSLHTLAAPPELPQWARQHWQTAGLDKAYSRTTYVQPGFLVADFNGDGKQDVAVLVVKKQNHSRGIVILHQGTPQPYVLGTGSNLSKDMLQGDFEWATYWHLYRKPTTFEVTFDKSGDIAGDRTVRLRHPTIELGQEESGGGMIYWNGQKYIWLHQTC
ncbi:FG-GAP repeat protein [Hymenobacter chitinivorans]|uniref:VCBS repeat protein n=1 Tax=Hymenobacter chitinivorans DSM 11115 TaxID=1121954 RepID=A0A2M9AQU0_9BACT|nr:FG-GAP repeat protein [Hymenobacter chitinivorans]PJJ48060.1 hypothetical protein CLV45_4753 [Hymenobacter chitinivorans DSM 11115]